MWKRWRRQEGSPAFLNLGRPQSRRLPGSLSEYELCLELSSLALGSGIITPTPTYRAGGLLRPAELVIDIYTPAIVFQSNLAI